MPVTVKSLWRFPFKSMLGEELPELSFGETGHRFDRAFALLDPATHRKITARQLPDLLKYRARVASDAVEIVFPDGTVVAAEDQALVDHFSARVGKKVLLAKARDERNPRGLFDDSSILLASIQALDSLAKRAPRSVFDFRRFRANIWVDAPGKTEFPEEQWLNRQLDIGGKLLLNVDRLCERCVITTMPQEDLPQDYDVLKTIVSENRSVLGVYCSIATPGTIKAGDPVSVV